MCAWRVEKCNQILQASKTLQNSRYDIRLVSWFLGFRKRTHKTEKDNSKQPVLFSKATWMNFGQVTVVKDGKPITVAHPNEVWLRYSFDKLETWSKVSLLKGRRKEEPNIHVPLSQKYPDGHPIKSKKLRTFKRWFHSFQYSIVIFMRTFHLCLVQKIFLTVNMMTENSIPVGLIITIVKAIISYLVFINVMGN